MVNETSEPETIVEEEVEVEENPEQVSEIRINNGDDMSDMFKPPSRNDPDMQVDDLIAVDEEDVFGEGGSDLSDLTDVTSEDIMGEEDPWGTAKSPPQPPPTTIRRRIIRRTPPPTAPIVREIRY